MPVRISWSFNPRKFRTDEGGDILVFSVFTLVVMALIGGIAIDIGYYERSRTDLQTSLGQCSPLRRQPVPGTRPTRGRRKLHGVAGFPDVPSTWLPQQRRSAGSLSGEQSVQACRKPTRPFSCSSSVRRPSISVFPPRPPNVWTISKFLSFSMSPDRWSTRRTTASRRSSTCAKLPRLCRRRPRGYREGARINFHRSLFDQGERGKPLLDELGATQEHDYSHCVISTPTTTLRRRGPSPPLPRTGHFQFQAMSTHSQRQHLGQWTCRIDDGFEVTPFSDYDLGSQDRHIKAVPGGKHIHRYGREMGACPAGPLDAPSPPRWRKMA